MGDVRNTLLGKRLTDTIQLLPPGEKSNEETLARKAQALMFLRRHIHPALRKQYLLKNDPADLWATLQERFNNVHDAQHPELQEKWDKFWLLDYLKVNDFYQDILELQSELAICGIVKTDQAMIEKSLGTFPTSMDTLAHQCRADYKQGRLRSFSDLMSVLAKKERYREILLQNNVRPASKKKVHETYNICGNARKDKEKGGRGGGGRGRGENSRNLTWSRYDNNSNKNQSNYGHKNGENSSHSASTSRLAPCYRCSATYHMHKQCRAPNDIQNAYKMCQQYQAKQTETHYADYEMEDGNEDNLILAGDTKASLETSNFS